MKRHAEGPMSRKWNVNQIAERIAALAEGKSQPVRLQLSEVAGSEDPKVKLVVASTTTKAIYKLSRLLSEQGIAVEYRRGTPAAPASFRVWRP
ncbi:MAG: hypothetical protein DDT34_01679 [Firmicutes bacterium]|nr:hypothetical protein [Bacillota bacterium]MBT9165361.1 hypothetical protein [Chloroflexota bacterium]